MKIKLYIYNIFILLELEMKDIYNQYKDEDGFLYLNYYEQ